MQKDNQFKLSFTRKFKIRLEFTFLKGFAYEYCKVDARQDGVRTL